MNSYYEWYRRETINPKSGWGFLNETAGYRQVNIRMTPNATVNVYVYFGIVAHDEQYVTSQDQFEIQQYETVFKTYEVKGSSLQVALMNPSETTGASVIVAIYITT